MGNQQCNATASAQLSAVVRDFCPFPDYSYGPLYNVLSANTSVPLSEHYAAVQASLTPPQQQDFTQTLRRTFGKEGVVSHGGVGIVALSLAVLFDAVGREVRGEFVSDHEPIPGLFFRDPRGTYPQPAYTISRYLRLVPHIANNPTRMKEETEKYLRKLNNDLVQVSNFSIWNEDYTVMNIFKALKLRTHLDLHMKRILKKTIDEDRIKSSRPHREEPEMFHNLNCDLKVANEKFVAYVHSDSRSKEAFDWCVGDSWGNKTAIELVVDLDWLTNIFLPALEDFDPSLERHPQTLTDFDLKEKAISTWI